MPARKPTLNQLNVVVGDMHASIDFYRRLGVELPEPQEEAPYHVGAEAIGGMDFDLDIAKFAEVWNRSWAGRKDLVGRVVIGFGFDTREEIDATYGELTGAGYKGLAAPFDAFWGARYAIVEDPNGVAVGLMSPVDPDRRSWPPENWNS